MAEQVSFAERIAAFTPLFVASLVHSRGMREANRQKTDKIKTKILLTITMEIQKLLKGYEIIDSEWDDCYSEQVQSFFCENGWAGEMWQMNYSIRSEIVGLLARILHSGFLVDGRMYYIDTYNDLVFRFLELRHANVTIDDLTLITEEEHQSREKWSDLCHDVLRNEMEDAIHTYGSSILRVDPYHSEKSTPIDPGFTANILKYFYVEQSRSLSGLRGEKYALSRTTAKIEALKGDSKTFPKLSRIIIWLLKENPVERSCIQSVLIANGEYVNEIFKYYV